MNSGDSIHEIQVERDHLEKLCRAKPVSAIAELIWNALDADAKNVRVALDRGDVGIRSIRVEDDGSGIEYATAGELFRKLGGSWKASADKTTLYGRAIHGEEGRGRFKALSLGRVCEWQSTYRAADGPRAFRLTVFADDVSHVRLSAEEPTNTAFGVAVTITEVESDLPSLESESTAQQLSETFALYLTNYADVSIRVAGWNLDPTPLIQDRHEFPLSPLTDDQGLNHACTLKVVEWKRMSHRSLYLCGEAGLPLLEIETRFHTPDLQFSAYLCSSYFDRLRRNGTLDLAELQKPVVTARAEAVEQLKRLADSNRSQRAARLVQQWKDEDVYPYRGEPNNPVDLIERQVFDAYAVNIDMHVPEIMTGSRKSKALHLRLIQQAIKSSPEELQTVLQEIVGLPKKKLRELAELLRETSLSAIISATKLVTDRLKFLRGLEEIVFDNELRAATKERSQLHRILAENAWIFGEEFNLTVDDESLTQVLRQHVHLLGDDTVIDEPVRAIDGGKGIVDLMFSRTVRLARSDELDHLVVELKAPRVKIGADQLQQIKRYAFTVSEDVRFLDRDTRWTFWILSTEIDRFGKQELAQANRPPGCLYVSDNGRLTIWAKTWGQVIGENQGRLKFFKEALEHEVDTSSALQHMRTAYQETLGELLGDAQPDAQNDDGVVEQSA